MSIFKKYQAVLLCVCGLFLVSSVFAETPSPGGNDISSIATGITTTLGSIGKLMVAIAYLAGFGFLMFGILKFKQHKDNPQQVTLGVPIVMTIIGSVLLFVGSFIAPLGASLGIDTTKQGDFQIPGTK
jgi:intracellular multiplication protein IcmD